MKSIIILFLLFIPNGFQRVTTKKRPTKRPYRVPPCQCKVNTHDLVNISHTAMFLHHDEARIFYPNYRERFIVIKTGDSMDVFCTGYRGMYLADKLILRQRVKLTCLQGLTFHAMEMEVNLTDIRCVERIVSYSWNTKKICGVKGREIQIGYNLDNNTFLWQYSVCFNFILQTTEYARSIILPMVTWKRIARKIGEEKPNFFNVSRPLYVYYNHMALINRQIGRPDRFVWLNCYREQFRITKHYLIPQLDFYYDFEQRTTNYYLNIVPQFNKVRWHFVRSALRWYAKKNKVQLDVYTGTMRHLKLYHIKNQTLIKIYLDSRRKKLPVSDLIWKAAYDKKNKAGVAVILGNNYFYNNIFQPLCPDISSKLPWMAGMQNYSFACEYVEWANIVRYSLPRLDVNKILGEEFVVPEAVTMLKPREM